MKRAQKGGKRDVSTNKVERGRDLTSQHVWLRFNCLGVAQLQSAGSVGLSNQTFS